MKLIVDRLATEYRDQGNGPVILLLHGWKDTMHGFDSMIDSLSKSFRVLSLDLPGFGQTDKPEKDWFLDDYIEFVLMFLEKINVQPDYLIGHSFGGRIILKALAQKKMSPKKVVLIASAGVTKVNTTRNGFFMLLAKLGKLVIGFLLLPSLQKKIKQRFYHFVQSDYSTAGVLTGTYLNIIREDLSNLVKDITVPTLLIWGSNDKATLLADANFLAREIQDARLEVFEGKSHFVHKEEPEAVSDLIKEFCR